MLLKMFFSLIRISDSRKNHITSQNNLIDILQKSYKVKHLIG